MNKQKMEEKIRALECLVCLLIENDTKRKMSEAHKGKKFTDEHKRKMSQNHADFKGKNHPMYGKKHSEESKQNMKQAQQARRAKERGI